MWHRHICILLHCKLGKPDFYEEMTDIVDRGQQGRHLPGCSKLLMCSPIGSLNPNLGTMDKWTIRWVCNWLGRGPQRELLSSSVFNDIQLLVELLGGCKGQHHLTSSLMTIPDKMGCTHIPLNWQGLADTLKNWTALRRHLSSLQKWTDRNLRLSGAS